MKRHHIVEGDFTTVGGIVTSASSTYFINGKRVSLEGDYVSCIACHSIGYIICTGPRIEERENGKLLALENDICTCKCSPHPRLIPSQSVSFHTIEGAGKQIDTFDHDGKSLNNSHANIFFDDRFVIQDPNGMAIANVPYAIERANGEVEYGETDSQGHTHILSTTAAIENIKIYIAG